MADVYPLGDYKEEYIDLLQDYDFDPDDIVATGNLIGFLHEYIYNPRAYLVLQENLGPIMSSKSAMLDKLMEVLLDDQHDDVSMLISLELAQASFFYGNWKSSLDMYRILLNWELDRVDLGGVDPYDIDFSDLVLRLIHNICTIYHLSGNDDDAYSFKSTLQDWFDRDWELNQRFMKNHPEYAEKTERQMDLLHNNMSSLYLSEGPSSSDYGDLLEAMALDIQDDPSKSEDLRLSIAPCLINISDDQQSIFVNDFFDDSLDSLIYWFDNPMVESSKPIANSKESSSVSGEEQPADDNTELSTDEEPNETLEELLDHLNNLVGLNSVKKDVNSLINLLKVSKIREQRGIKMPAMSLHLVFYGNPGTGKTTVARLLAKIYHKMGILSKGQLVEVDRSGLVGGYVGQTAIKTKDVIDKALGGILFIDEAYTLASESGNDYGQEAIDTILKAMEDHRDDFIVIVAGYPNQMATFLASNPGLKSRFNKYLEFEDYEPAELLEMLDKMCAQYGVELTDEARDYAMNLFQTTCTNRPDDFANGRAVRNFFEDALTAQANRLAAENDFEEGLSIIKAVDLANAELA
ncbi:AAA family ATPase [Limosilactobacillus mucosae]|uniref:AAA family ATPase n=1 Tax=Limosilactobacillus mucosae TaxID=97478 RepID=UPI0039949009